VECFLCLEEAGIVAVGGDTQVSCRLDILETNVMSQEQEKGHAAVTFRSVGLHWVASRNSSVVSYDFVSRSDYPTKGAVFLMAAVNGDLYANLLLLQ
jgi:hypothetical protein